MDVHAVNTSDVPLEKSGQGHTRHLMRAAARGGTSIMIRYWGPDTNLPVHSHPYNEMFYVLEGEMRLFLQNPKEEIRLKPGDTFTAVAKRPHLVTNVGKGSLTFLVLQGMGEYDYVPMV